jgi:hypothetical protein
MCLVYLWSEHRRNKLLLHSSEAVSCDVLQRSSYAINCSCSGTHTLYLLSELVLHLLICNKAFAILRFNNFTAISFTECCWVKFGSQNKDGLFCRNFVERLFFFKQI